MKINKDHVDVVLVVPHNPPSTNIVAEAFGITLPLGIAYIAGYLRKNGLDVEILDNNVDHCKIEQFKDYLFQAQPRYIGISLLTYAVSNAFSFASAAKEVNKDVTIIAGGPHASALPREVLRHGDIDIVVKGEGEVTVFELLRALDEKRDLRHIQGIVYKENGVIIENPDREAIRDLDSLPIPAYDLLPMDKYFLSASRRLTKGKSASIITTRGCPYRCTFCSRAVFGQTIRFRKPEAVIDEIKYLVRQFGIQELIFWDDTLTLDKNHAITISRLLKKHVPGIVWSCYSRADHFSDELYHELYEGGCRQLSFGVESGSQKILDSIDKDLCLRDITDAVDGCRKHKLSSFCSFVFGFPAETKETIEETIRFAKKLNPDFATFCCLTPLPGSMLFDGLLSNGLVDLKNVQWDHFVNLMSMAPPPIQTGSVGKKDLISFQKKAFLDFYFRPEYISSTLKRINSKETLRQVIRGLSAILKYKFSKII